MAQGEKAKKKRAPVVSQAEEKPGLSAKNIAVIRLSAGVVFGILGAIASLAWLPPLLENLLERLTASMAPDTGGGPVSLPAIQIPLALLGFVVGGFIGSLLAGLTIRLARAWERMATGEKVDVFIGGFLGLVAAMPFVVLFQTLQAATPVVLVGLILFFAAISIYMLRTMREALPWHKKGREVKHVGIKVLDTNILIDGRILDLARAGFLEGDLYVAGFVLSELQHIADSSDAGKRQRGRRGLDVLKSLQAEFPLIVGQYDELVGEVKEVDAALVVLAREVGGDLVTNDYNLNSVASANGIRVLNINDAAVALRLALMPGEPLKVQLIREGSQHGQGVGYMEDGTMVVVEGGAPMIGQTIEAEVTQVIQTDRGKMVFASVDETPERAARRR